MLEYFGVITGLIYMVLEMKQHRVMWIVGFFTSLVYVFVFFSAKLYADMSLQAYYVLISMYGFWLWSRTRKQTKNAEQPASGNSILYKHLSLPLAAGILLSMLVVYFIIYYILIDFTDSPVPMGDAFTTAVGIVATWMLARRIIEHWYLWVVANLVSIYIYYLRGLYPTMFLYLCYALLAVGGLYIWIKKGNEIDGKTI